MASRSEGLVPIVLRENPNPGRAAVVAGAGVLGLLGSFSNNLRAVESKLSKMLSLCQ